jgi:AbrB family looped-hinge helix DNA binding protein
MQAVKLSSNGRISLPKNIISRYNWSEGQKLQVIDTGDGILLKSVQSFKTTQLDEVVGILKHSGKTVSLEEMEEAIRKGALERE